MLRFVLPLALIASVLTNAWLYTRWQKSEKETKRPSAHATGTAPAPSMTPAVASPPVSFAAGSRFIPVNTEAEARDLRARLEAAGLPPETVRAVLALSVHMSFQKRRAALLHPNAATEYWRNLGSRRGAVDPELRELEREQRRVVREIGGDDFEMDEASYARQYGAMPVEKVGRLKKIFADYQDLEEQMFADGGDRGTPENRARAALLAREKRADIERLLTPDELRDYDYRNSPGAHQLRNRFGRFESTEEEFIALYPTFQSVFDETMQASLEGKGNQAEVRAAREAADKRLDAELQRVLGPQRYSEFKEANDHLLQETRNFTASLNLPASTAAEVVAIQREFSPKLNAVDRDRDLSPNQRDAQASDLGMEARDRLIRLLGPENFEAYKRKGGGWLGSALNRRPPAPSPKP